MSQPSRSSNHVTKIVPQRVESLSSSVNRISSSDPKKVYQGLVELRTKYVKQVDGVARIRQHGGLECVLRVLASSNAKHVDVALSILGNCCMEDRSRTKLLHSDGIEKIVSVMKSAAVESVKNRACRTIANLAMDAQCCSAVHDNDDALPCIVSFLNTTEDEDSQQTYTRALRLLADTPSHKMAVLECEGLKAVGELLKAEKNPAEPVVSSALKTLAHFMQDLCSVESTRQLISSDSLTSLLNLCNHEKSAISSTSRALILVSLKQERLRPPLGNAGCIEFLMDTVTGDTFQPKQKYSYLNALCLCCHEVVNRVRIKERGGLQLFLKLLDDRKFHLIHFRIISALVCFLYDDQGFDILLQNNLVDLLLKQLRHCSQLGAYAPSVDISDTLISHADEGDVAADEMPDEDYDCSQDMFTDDKDPEETIDVPTASAALSNKNPSLTLIIPSQYELAEIENKIGNDDTLTEETGSTELLHAFPITPTPEALPAHSGSSENTTDMKKPSVEDAPEATASETSEEKGRETEDAPGTSYTSLSSTISECIALVDPADSDSQGLSSDTDARSNPPKYSMDSPTYKEVSEWKFGSLPYHAGPTNIYESGRYYSNSNCPSPAGRSLASPPRTGPYSPMSVSSYLSSDWSPEGSPAREASQNSCTSWSPTQTSPSPPASAGLSPTPAALSEFDLAWDRRNRGEAAIGRSPAWSSATNSQNTTTGYQSPDSLSRAPSPPVQIGTGWWGDTTMPVDVIHNEYSSEEEETEDSAFSDSLDTTNAAAGVDLPAGSQDPMSCSPTAFLTQDSLVDVPVSSLCPSSTEDSSSCATSSLPQASGDVTSSLVSQTIDLGEDVPQICDAALAADAVYDEAMSSTDLGAMLRNQSMSVAVSDESSSKPSSPSGRRSFVNKRKREPTTPETKQKILKVIASDNRGKSLDIHKLISRLSSTTTEADDTPKHDEVNIHKDPVKITQHNILVLLSRVSYLTNPASYLVKQLVFETLLDYIMKSEKPLSRCSRILVRLGKNPHCLEPCIREFIPVLLEFRRQDVPAESKAAEVIYQIVSYLSLVCESRFGQGVIEHLLKTGSARQRQQCSLSLPILCRSSALRKKVYGKQEGLKLLLDCLTHDQLQPYAVLSLHQLAAQLGLHQPEQTTARADTTPAEERADHDVIFRLDDGTTVGANRAIMIRYSDVFAAMLAGHYSESGQSEVNISNTTAEAFKTLIDFAHNRPYRISLLSDTCKLDVMLESTALADKYCVSDLLLVVSNNILDDYLNTDHVAKILLFAMMHNNDYLCRRCLFYMLTTKMKNQRRQLCFAPCLEANGEEFKHRILSYITDIISGI